MDVVYGLFHHRLSVARKGGGGGGGGGGEEKRVEEPVFEPCQGLKLFSLSSARNMTNSTYFYQCRPSSLFDGVGICIFVLCLCKKAACA